MSFPRAIIVDYKALGALKRHCFARRKREILGESWEREAVHQSSNSRNGNHG